MKRSRLFCLWWWTKEYRGSWTEKVYQEVSERMAAHIYSRLYIKRTMKQCREKLKKLKNDYWFTKDHNGRRGSTRRCWKRFNGSYLLAPHQPATGGRLSCCIIGDVRGRIPFDVRSLLHLRHGAPSSPASSPPPASGPVPARTLTLSTSTSSTSQQLLISGKRKRCNRKLDLPSVLVEMQAEEEWSHSQHDENIWLLLSEARENEAALQWRRWSRMLPSTSHSWVCWGSWCRQCWVYWGSWCRQCWVYWGSWCRQCWVYWGSWCRQCWVYWGSWGRQCWVYWGSWCRQWAASESTSQRLEI
ncbi:uncharacterized protein LOC129347727 [Amphiprion ocellaris]|uniref:uncharacterized protein LOC129347727 n=1 Tax=Amphiprion ocellaris TaxID=80972 RepID=UPI00241152C1|nr:uncharacterized protein LOC129347727 [Amphiprion ocellaris]